MTVGALSLGPTARLVGRFGPMRVLIAGMLVVIGSLGLLGTTDAGTSFLTTICLADFGLDLGIGSAFMPLPYDRDGGRAPRRRRARLRDHQRGSWLRLHVTSSAATLSAQLVTDAVIAVYIHEISGGPSSGRPSIPRPRSHAVGTPVSGARGRFVCALQV
jgi:hypothetical protein